jgi:hypothetical protein
MERQRLTLAVLGAAAEEHGLTLLKPSGLLCGPDLCKVSLGRVLLYRDEDHLSTAGALHISSLFDAVMSGIAQYR